MDKLILSMLLTKSMTIYEIKMYTEKVLGTVCSNSLGSLQAALKKLLISGTITVREYVDKGFIKKEYHITAEGVSQFVEWMQTPIQWYKQKNMEEGKFFYLGMMPKEKRLRMLEKLLSDMEKELQSLQNIKAIVASTRDTIVQTSVKHIMEEKDLVEYLMFVSEGNTLGEVVENIARYQCYLLEYGLDKIANDIAFFTAIYEREKAACN